MSDNTSESASVGESAEQLMEKSRLRSLFKARDQAADAIREAPLREFEMAHKQMLPYEQVIDEHVRSAVTAYILECEPLLQNTEAGREFWFDYDFAPVPLPSSAPDEVLPGDGPNSTLATGVRDKQVLGIPDSMLDENGRQIALSGISAYVELPSPIKIRWIGYSSTGFHGANQENTAVTTVSIPRSLSESAFRAVNNLLAELNIGLNAADDQDTVYNISLGSDGEQANTNGRHE